MINLRIGSNGNFKGAWNFNLHSFCFQIFELEKRFLYQKYLSPADRDEIAAQLGLTNAQVHLVSQDFDSIFKPY
jgi:hypothetical protein